jgi:hypothetical protein
MKTRNESRKRLGAAGVLNCLASALEVVADEEAGSWEDSGAAAAAETLAAFAEDYAELIERLDDVLAGVGFEASRDPLPIDGGTERRGVERPCPFCLGEIDEDEGGEFYCTVCGRALDEDDFENARSVGVRL